MDIAAVEEDIAVAAGAAPQKDDLVGLGVDLVNHVD